MTLAFFLIALVYSSAGFGGGSMYISVLSNTTPLPSALLRFHALICNAIVTGQGIAQWKSAVSFPRSAISLLITAAIPCGVAVFFPLSETYFLKTLGSALLLAGLLMFFQEQWKIWEISWSSTRLHIAAFVIGGIGGFTGIGGGIYLSPLLHLSRWGNAKEIAQLSAWFIFINSLVSIAILHHQGIDWYQLDWTWMLAVLLGGLIGSRISISWLKIQHIRGVTAFLLIFAGIRILLK